MHPYLATGGICALLVLAGTALSFAAPSEEARDDHTIVHASSRSGHGHGAGAHPWVGGEGSTPSSADATELESHDDIVIRDDAGFNPANGIRSGTGTFADPFIISGWNVRTIHISDTTKAFIIRENYVRGIMVLDWTGPGGYVHHNHIENLRTNRNVERLGDPSATVIENNVIKRVEELRHFDGIVRNNTIGQDPTAPPEKLVELPRFTGPMGDLLRTLSGVSVEDGVTFNIAGLNGAGIHDNLILGGVDMKIHGHHHSDAPGSHSHNHGAPDATQGEDHVEDHQVRYVDFLFYNNTIRDVGFGLRYNDLAHAGDDRTATSEQEPDLEKPHVHHTRVGIVNNVIEGATLRIAILNSPDERHLPGQTGDLFIQDNRIVKPSAGDGIVVSDVADARVHVSGNVVERGGQQVTGTSAILLQRFKNSTILVDKNELGDYKYGVRASQFDVLTTWTVGRNDDAATEQAVYWDDSVPNAPEGDARDDGHDHSHAGGHEMDAATVWPILRPRLL